MRSGESSHACLSSSCPWTPLWVSLHWSSDLTFCPSLGCANQPAVSFSGYQILFSLTGFKVISQNRPKPPSPTQKSVSPQKMQPLQAWVRPALWQHRATLQHDCVACGEGEKMLCPRGAAGGMKGRGPSPPKSLGHWLYQKCWDHFQSDSVHICITQLNPHPEPHTAQSAEWQVAS